MDEKEVFNPQSGERIAPKKPKKFWKDWRFYVYTLIAIMLGIVSISSMVTACAAINAGVGSGESSSFGVSNVKRAQITTEEGGFTGYTFSVESVDSTLAENYQNKRVWSVDRLTYNRTYMAGQTSQIEDGYSNVVSSINTWNGIYMPTATNEINFVLIEGYSALTTGGTKYHWHYFSFLTGNSPNVPQRSFILKNRTFLFSQKTTAQQNSGVNRYNPIIITNDVNHYFVFDETSLEASAELAFQDSISYYQELGYRSGYDDGYDDGFEAGETSAYETMQTGIAFDSYGMYANATISLVADRTEGSYYYMDLFDYVTDSYVERSVYVLWTRATNNTYIGYVMDVNNSDSSGATYQIGRFSGATSLSSVVFTADMDRNLWEGAYITTFHGHAEAVNHAFWFTGGSYAASQQLYQDGYDEGYDAGENAGYSSGYEAGIDVGYTQGMNAADPESLTNTLVAVFQQPFNQIYRFFNFNILGINMLGLATGLLSVMVILKVFRKLIK